MSARWAGFARLGGIGDNLIVASVLRPLKKLGYKTEVIASSKSGLVYLNNPFLDKLSIRDDGDITGDWHEWFAARAREYDLFADLSHFSERRHSLLKSDAAFWWRRDYRRKLCAGSYLETAHAIMGVPHEFGPLFFPTEEEMDRAKRTKDRQIKGRYIVWIISGSRVDEVYPYTAMAIARLIKELDVSVVMVDVDANKSEYAKRIEADVRRTNSSIDRLHLALSSDMADCGVEQIWPVRRSLTQILAADLVITPDAGAAWAAAFEPMPKIVLLSHASADNVTKHWINTTTLHANPDRVPCWPCHRLHADMSTCVPNKDNGAGAACISDISVQTIIDKARDAIST